MKAGEMLISADCNTASYAVGIERLSPNVFMFCWNPLLGGKPQKPSTTRSDGMTFDKEVALGLAHQLLTALSQSGYASEEEE